MHLLRSILIATAIAGLAAPVTAGEPPTQHATRATAYCLTGRMADGTFTRDRSAAMNGVPFGTRVYLRGAQAFLNGRRVFYVRDRIGHGTELDLWTPSCHKAIQWGRRGVTYTLERPAR